MNTSSSLKRYTVPLFEKPFHGKVILPGSKSITNRVFPLAVLSGFFSPEVPILFSGALKSEDSYIMKEALLKMGATVEEVSQKSSDSINADWKVSAGTFFSDTNHYEIFCANSGYFQYSSL